MLVAMDEICFTLQVDYGIMQQCSLETGKKTVAIDFLRHDAHVHQAFIILVASIFALFYHITAAGPVIIDYRSHDDVVSIGVPARRIIATQVGSQSHSI